MRHLQCVRAIGQCGMHGPERRLHCLCISSACTNNNALKEAELETSRSCQLSHPLGFRNKESFLEAPDLGRTFCFCGAPFVSEEHFLFLRSKNLFSPNLRSISACFSSNMCKLGLDLRRTDCSRFNGFSCAPRGNPARLALYCKYVTHSDCCQTPALAPEHRASLRCKSRSLSSSALPKPITSLRWAAALQCKQ